MREGRAMKKEIEGTVTISLKDFRNMQQERQQAEERAAALEEKANKIRDEVTDMIQFDDKEFLRRIEAIDNPPEKTTDAQIRKMFDEAVGTLKLIVDPEKLKKLIRKHIDKDRSENCEDLKHAEDKVLKKIEIILKSE
jgi:methionine synthase II (cobalamin-independent)